MIKITKTTGLILFLKKFLVQVDSQVDLEVQAKISLARTSSNNKFNSHRPLYKEVPMCLCPR